jgi:hypothetical protein
MELALRVLLVGLAAWRVSALMSYERGPFSVVARLRGWIAIVARPDGEVVVDGWFGRLRLEAEQMLSCIWCLSPWTAVGMWFVWGVSPAVVAVGAAAAIIVLVERLARG